MYTRKARLKVTRIASLLLSHTTKSRFLTCDCCFNNNSFLNSSFPSLEKLTGKWRARCREMVGHKFSMQNNLVSPREGHRVFVKRKPWKKKKREKQVEKLSINVIMQLTIDSLLAHLFIGAHAPARRFASPLTRINGIFSIPTSSCLSRL